MFSYDVGQMYQIIRYNLAVGLDKVGNFSETQYIQHSLNKTHQ